MIPVLLLVLLVSSNAAAEAYFKSSFHYTGTLFCPSGNMGNASVWLMEENDLINGGFDDVLSGDQPLQVRLGHPFEINGRISWPAFEGRYREPYLLIRHYCSGDSAPSSHPRIAYYALPLESSLNQRIDQDIGPINILLDVTVTLERRAGTMDDHADTGTPIIRGFSKFRG
ncbi:hypothetical protein PRIPAC_83585 [Pristionchus pacificus]|uniref:Uncharacterized protein n=1 Tax=Pristionchus pacificus TaxID=54126 RepID=A0A2A6BV85_PRIPA|nr:hypothetical protein PRIPAC_83585 [Pristionchus pacificus]|eukprot:PDM69703.1 hypothetical protein PRIPAC_44799 [Pristionchus pacificus]